MGRERGEPAGEVLPTDGGRQGATVTRTRPLVAAGARDRPNHEPGAGGQGVSMRPKERDLDDEIRGHLALSIKERIEQGEDPDTARFAALREFGYIPAHRE